MLKKSIVSQELVNLFPDWTRVRSDSQSVGYQLLNTFGIEMENMERCIQRIHANQFLQTANLDEIDLVYKYTIDPSFEFETDTTDPVVTVTLPPTVSGLIDGTWYDVTVAPDNDIQSFWYDSYPDRFSLGETITGVSHDLVSFTASGILVSGEWSHHLGGGRVYVETVGGTQYIKYEDNNLRRGRVVLEGYSRENVFETETIICPWDMIQPSIKEWNKITKVSAYNIEDSVTVYLTSANFNADEYLLPFNTGYSKNRRKVDLFWGLGTEDFGSTLDLRTYITDEWQQLIQGFIDKQDLERWACIKNGEYQSYEDITFQPFTNRIWAITTSGILDCYLADQSMISGVNLIKTKTTGSHVRIEVEDEWVLPGDDISFTSLHSRPLQEVQKYRLWFQIPDGTKFGLLNNNLVDFSSNFWVLGRTIERVIAPKVSITTSGLGEYLLGLDVEFIDGTYNYDRRIVPVNYKEPVISLDISSIVGTNCHGIDFDADQKMWIETSSNYYNINLHTDIMLIDYQDKIFYFKEPYEQVSIDND